MGVSKHTGRHMGASKHTGGHSNIWGHPNIQGTIQTYGVSKLMGASKCIGAYGHPLSLTKHAFFVLCMYRGHQNRGAPLFWCPLNMWTLPYVWMPPYVWKMFGCPLYIHNTKKGCFVTVRGVHMHHTFDCPICLDVPMFWCLPYVWMPPYVWKIFGCPLYIHNTKKACFVTLRGVHMPHTYVWMAPCMFECHQVWTPPVCLDAPHVYTAQRKHDLSY